MWSGNRTLADIIRAERQHTSATDAPPDDGPAN